MFFINRIKSYYTGTSIKTTEEDTHIIKKKRKKILAYIRNKQRENFIFVEISFLKNQERVINIKEVKKNTNLRKTSRQKISNELISCQFWYSFMLTFIPFYLMLFVRITSHLCIVCSFMFNWFSVSLFSIYCLSCMNVFFLPLLPPSD